MSAKGVQTENPRNNPNAQEPTASCSTGILGGILRFFEILFTPITLVINFLFGESSQAEKKDMSDLEGRVSVGKPDTVTDRLSDDHRRAALDILKLVESKKEVKDFLNCKKFTKKFDKLPIEMKQAFIKYVGSTMGALATPTYTAGFFAAMSSQLKIREIVLQAKGGNFAETSYNSLPLKTKEAFQLFLNRRGSNFMNQENLHAFFSLLEISEIQSEKEMTPNERNLKELERIQRYFKGEFEDWKPNFSVFPNTDILKDLTVNVRDELQRGIVEVFLETHAVSKRQAEYLKCIQKVINKVKKQVQSEQSF